MNKYWEFLAISDVAQTLGPWGLAVAILAGLATFAWIKTRSTPDPIPGGTQTNILISHVPAGIVLLGTAFAAVLLVAVLRVGDTVKITCGAQTGDVTGSTIIVNAQGAECD